MVFIVIIAVIALVFFITGVSAVFNGWVLTQLWAWFIVPFFHARPLTIAYAIGIALVVRFFTYDYTNLRLAKEKTDGGWVDVVMPLLYPYIGGLFTLLFGYIVHLYL